jgi:hypothetical protein
MGLPTHFRGLHSHDIENYAICREQHVQIPLQVFFGELVGQATDIEATYDQRLCLSWNVGLRAYGAGNE